MQRLLATVLCAALVLLAAASPALAQRLVPDRNQYVVGERVKLAVADAPGSGRDRVGIYNASDATHTSPLYWQYLQGGQEPSTSGPTEASLTFLPMSLPRGEYEARLFFEDATRPSARVRFNIVEAGPVEAPAPEGNLTVLCFNIWVQGARGHGGLDEVIRFIASTRADVIALQECSADTLSAILAGLQRDPLYANAQASGATGIISRFPITDTYTQPGLRGYGVRIALPESIAPGGEAIRVFNSHLTPYPYGPYELRDGATVSTVLDIERSTRGSEMNAILAQLVQHRAMDNELTTILVGDHNCPSHLDWTPQNADQNFGAVIAWPVSTTLHGFGFNDSYRQVHPDPVAHRALTWSPGYPKHTLDARDVHDRIDMIYHRVQEGRTLRPVQAYTIDRDPWPSDHRAVVVSFEYRGQSIQRAQP